MIYRLLALAAVLTPVFSTPNGRSANKEMSSAAVVVTYRVTFQSSWSASTHPQGFPSNPHFSGLIGATHSAAVSLWDAGQLASAGIESMAETGSKSQLIAEVNGAVADGHAEFLLSGNGIGRSPGQVVLEFDVSESHPLVTLVSMLAPSPDWFAGVSGLDLFEGGAWAQRLEVPLLVYDSGTDSGPSYTSPNNDTDPAAPITELTNAPFNLDQQVGTFVFELQSGVGVELDDLPSRVDRVEVYPNPTMGHVTVESSGGDDLIVEVFDLLGRLVADGRSASSGRIELDLDGSPRGVYVLRVKTAAGVESTTLLMAR